MPHSLCLLAAPLASYCVGPSRWHHLLHKDAFIRGRAKNITRRRRLDAGMSMKTCLGHKIPNPTPSAPYRTHYLLAEVHCGSQHLSKFSKHLSLVRIVMSSDWQILATTAK